MLKPITSKLLSSLPSEDSTFSTVVNPNVADSPRLWPGKESKIL